VTANEPEYDIAISFLSQDMAIAAAFRDRLNEGLKVFFYPRNQEELAGTDGLESMRTLFLDRSRVAMVLYREPWGKTPWTRIEETAIKERCLDQGWHSLFFVMLDKGSTPPIWLPQTHIRFSYADFGLEQAIGAIKMRVQECGGTITPPTALSRAATVQEEALYLEDRRWLKSSKGILAINDQILSVYAEIEEVCKEIKNTRGLTFRVGSNAGRCVLTDNRVTLMISWQQLFSNSIEDCALRVVEFNAQLALPEERPLMYLWSEPSAINETRFLPELSRTRELCWVDPAKPTELLAPKALAEKCVIMFLDLVARANEGKIVYPSDKPLAKSVRFSRQQA
jgi:hypothetical protein